MSAELCLEFVEHLSRKQTEVLLKEIEDKTGVKWIESSENFILSGTFKQLEESRAYLQQGVNQSNGIVVSNDPKRKEATFQGHENKSSSPDGAAENQEDVNQNSPATAAEKDVFHPPKRINDETHTYGKVSSTSLQIQPFEIEPKIAKVFVKAHDKELEDIETKHRVEIPRKVEGSKFSLKPKDRCSADDYEEACNQFITLYQNMYQLIKMERFSLKSETKVINSRQVISQSEKNFPIFVEVCKDRKHWEMYGEASHIEEALKFIEKNGVQINREKENAVGEKGRRKQWKEDGEAMDVDQPEHLLSDKNPGNRLETLLG